MDLTFSSLKQGKKVPNEISVTGTASTASVCSHLDDATQKFYTDVYHKCRKMAFEFDTNEAVHETKKIGIETHQAVHETRKIAIETNQAVNKLMDLFIEQNGIVRPEQEEKKRVPIDP